MPDEPVLRDGVWLVVVKDQVRYELEWDLPRIGGDEVAERIRALDGKALWARALAGADMMTDPVDVFLGLVAESFE